MPANTQNLKPFEKGSDRAREAGRKGGRTNARKAAAIRAQSKELDETLASLAARGAEGRLGDQAEGLALTLIARVERGEIEVKGSDVASILKVMHDIARLERGEVTTLSGHISGRVDDMERVRVMREEAERRSIGSTAGDAVHEISMTTDEGVGVPGTTEGVGPSHI